MKDKANLGIRVPEILLPSNEKVNMKKWAVIACDQFTANPQYWNEVERAVGSSPSTLHMILPEIYLEEPDKKDRIAFAKNTMKRYIDEGILELLPQGFVLVERHMGDVVRKGLMAALDLEEYSVDAEDKPLIRASEQTLMERIPPRMEIRRGAMVESPHVLVMIDDPDDTVIGPVYRERKELPMLYDFELMKEGGKIRGYMVENEYLVKGVLDAIAGLETVDGMRFCVGDGNHSLATAKAVWDETKALLPKEEWEGHPLRYALVEIINLQDANVQFMPIHRVLYKVNTTKCLQFILDKLNASGSEARLIYSTRRNNLMSLSDDFVIPFISKDSAGRIEITKPSKRLASEEIQPIIEQYLDENASSSVDYLHTERECLDIAMEYDNLALLMPVLKKENFFHLVAECGVMPKKTFSLGEAEQKRYYLECRLIENVEVEEEESEEPPMEEAPMAQELETLDTAEFAAEEQE